MQFKNQKVFTLTTATKKKKSKKWAWFEEQDTDLLELISEIGPYQWDMISSTMIGRTGKQCRERWHNQLNPLLKKVRWSVEEDWVLLILHQNKKNCWAQCTNFLLGRSDNSIKNYWNSTLVHRQAQMNHQLNKQLSYFSGEQLQAQQADILQAVLKKQLHLVKSQYIDCLYRKLDELRVGKAHTLAQDEKIRQFKIRFLEESLTTQPQMMKQSPIKLLRDPNNMIMNNLKASRMHIDHKPFVKLHLQNQLCRNIQSFLINYCCDSLVEFSPYHDLEPESPRSKSRLSLRSAFDQIKQDPELFNQAEQNQCHPAAIEQHPCHPEAERREDPSQFVTP